MLNTSKPAAEVDQDSQPQVFVALKKAEPKPADLHPMVSEPSGVILVAVLIQDNLTPCLAF